jgi:hypothetical protein
VANVRPSALDSDPLNVVLLPKIAAIPYCFLTFVSIEFTSIAAIQVLDQISERCSFSEAGHPLSGDEQAITVIPKLVYKRRKEIPMSTQAAMSTPGLPKPSPVRGARLHLWVLAIVLVSEAIGNISFSVGFAKLVLFPMLYALLIGALISIASPRIPSAIRIDEPLQRLASAMVQVSVLLLVAKLSLLVGSSIPKLLHSGWALAFQELGHFFGTVLFAMPIAIMLGVKREAVGATFSVGREQSLAIIAEKYGLNSPEGRGVLAEYITGTVVGTVFIAFLASIVKGLGIFHPVALAMGAGVGSASMMAAISLRQPLELISRFSYRCPSPISSTAGWNRCSRPSARAGHYRSTRPAA